MKSPAKYCFRCGDGILLGAEIRFDLYGLEAVNRTSIFDENYAKGIFNCSMEGLRGGISFLCRCGVYFVHIDQG